MTLVPTIILPTLLYFPFYLLLRWRYFGLPLHVDTGFYVSNHTILARKIRFREGWNATFALCSKVLPEYFYSLVYLRHPGPDYKFYSRFYLSLYNFASAIAVGAVAHFLFDGPATYALGLLLYGSISSEYPFGVYFECGELFEVLFQVLGFGLCMWGVATDNPLLIGAGTAIWFTEGFFIKTASVLSTTLLGAAAVAMAPAAALPALAAAGAAGLAWTAWVRYNGQTVARLVRPAAAHETRIADQIRQRLGTVADAAWTYTRRVFYQAPVIPMLALIGIAVSAREHPLLLAYTVAIAATCLFQAATIWYYTIPLLPPLALWATSGCVWLAQSGWPGWFVLGVLGSTWLGVYLAETFRGPRASLNFRVWQALAPPYPSIEWATAMSNQAAEEFCGRIKNRVSGQTLLVFGWYNQIYALLGTSYPTNLVSVIPPLDLMRPGWGEDLNRQLVKAPPAFIVDSDNCLDVNTLREKLGLNYQLADAHPPRFRLFGLVGRSGPPSETDLATRLHHWTE